MADDQQRQNARQLLEEASIVWRRDWDAVLVGFIVGALVTGVLWFWR